MVVMRNSKSATSTTSTGNRHKSRRKHVIRWLQNLLYLVATCLGVAYFVLLMKVLRYQPPTASGAYRQQPLPVPKNLVVSTKEGEGIEIGATQQEQQQQQRPPAKSSVKKLDFSGWKAVAIELAALSPAQVLEVLDRDDPFGVRTFERELLSAESQYEAFLQPEQLEKIFPCPSPQERITYPDQRDNQRAELFRNGTSNVFLFFQHLRKAGGTNFCTLAQRNLPKQQVPKYYCMPDYYWNMEKSQRCAGCFTRYTNEEITQHMHQDGHRILGNEWDPFDHHRFFDLPAIFTTSFRKPLDRALSQFRFECIEDRGCKIKNITQWWDRRKDLANVYTWTFSKQPVRKASIGNTQTDAKRRQELMGQALETVARFNLVLVMEWLAYAPQLVKNVLGFQDITALTERVRPHITQYERRDGQELNSMGAAGIAKASWTPKNYLSTEQYKRMSEDLALDEILTDAARRMFLERITCHHVPLVK